MYTAAREIKVQMTDGSVDIRAPGQKVPEAAGWPDAARWVAQGALIPDPGTQVPPSLRRKSVNIAVDPDGTPIDDVQAYVVRRNLDKADDKKLEKLCATYGIDPMSGEYRNRGMLRAALFPLIMEANEKSTAAAAERKRKAAQARHARHNPLGHLDEGEPAAASGDEFVIDNSPDPELSGDGEAPMPNADEIAASQSEGLMLDGDALSAMKNNELASYAEEHGIDLGGATKKADMVTAILEAQA